jgi:hypothetical protein
MCLACEMEALWFAEAQARAREDELAKATSQSPAAGDASPLPQRGEVKKAWSGFVCEKTDPE